MYLIFLAISSNLRCKSNNNEIYYQTNNSNAAIYLFTESHITIAVMILPFEFFICPSRAPYRMLCLHWSVK